MAPDRGGQLSSSSPRSSQSDDDHSISLSDSDPLHAPTSTANGARRKPTPSASPALGDTNFTFRGVVVGLAIGVIICFSNTYFGLQTGWVSGMAMPASLIGFAFFKTLSRHLQLPFTPVENVLVQTVAGAVGTMPLGLGFVGVMPALEFLLKDEEGAPVDLGLGRLILWGVGLCLFGVVFGVPLRKQVIIREKLKFPSGTATALMISVLHGGVHKDQAERAKEGEIETQGTEEREQLLHGEEEEVEENAGAEEGKNEEEMKRDWKRQIRLLVYAFGGSGTYTLLQYFVPVLHRLPVFGTYLANTWVWTLNPSPAYVGQGIIMGPATTFHMLLGAIIGWAVLSPLAKSRGWAPGPVDDWETGSKGWIVWVSLAIMLADAVVNLGWLVLRPTIKYGPGWYQSTKSHYHHSSTWTSFLLGPDFNPSHPISSLTPSEHPTKSQPPTTSSSEPPDDAPPHHLISGRTISWLLPLTLIICVITTHLSFGAYMPLPLNILALFLALLLSIMGVRALGETDLNPVSGISKLTQLIFALIVPSGRHANHAIVINLLAGAISESGALQAGDILQDLKAGHLIGASPAAQFYGQIIGSVVGAVVSAMVYKLYVSVYPIPGDLFQVPTAYVWIFTARLVTGKGLPDMAWEYALAFGGVFVATTCLRIYLAGLLTEDSQGGLSQKQKEWVARAHSLVPGGIAVAVGMYNTPSFTLARTAGGVIAWCWTTWRKSEGETRVIVLASGLILGEGVVSIVNLVLASAGVPHL